MTRARLGAIRWRARLPLDDRGAALPIVVVTMTLLIAGLGLAVDLGRIAVAGRSARTMADFAALDAVRELDGSTTAVQAPVVQAAAERSAQRNGLTGDPATAVTATAGTWDGTTKTFTPTQPTEVPDAVEVSVRNTGEGLFLRGAFAPQRTAIATRSGLAAAWVGPAPATLDVDDMALLNALAVEGLGFGSGLVLASWQQVDATTITLTDLALAAGVPPAQVQTVLDQTLTVDQAIQLLAAAAGGTPGGTALAALAGPAPPPTTVRLAQVLALGDGPGPLLTTPLPLLGLARGVLEVAAVGQPLTTTYTMPVTGASASSISFRYLDSSLIGIGGIGTAAHTARVRASIDLTLDAPANGHTVHVPLVVELGTADASITSVTCSAGATGAPSQVDVAASSAVAQTGVGAFDAGGAVGPGLLADAPPAAPAEGEGTVNVPATATPLAFATYDLVSTQPVGATATPGTAVEAALVVTGDPTLVADVEPSVRAAVPTLVDAVVPDLADLLGVPLGTAEVAVPGAGCTAPVLVR